MLVVLLFALCEMAAAANGAPESTASDAAPPSGPIDVEVLLATNRDLGPGGAPAEHFGSGRGALRFGTCTVRFSAIPGLAQISEKAPFYLPGETRSLIAFSENDEQAFWAEVAATVAAGRPLVLATHGYNEGFERACGRAAVIQRLWSDAGRLLLFTWPSDGDLLNYARDEADIAWSSVHLQHLIEGLVDRMGTGRLSVFAHSLGTRGVVNTLLRMGCHGPATPLLDQLVLAAPDIDAETFRGQLAGLVPLAQRITVYASDGDTPLKLSRELHGYPRLGEAGNDLVPMAGLEIVDVSAAGVYDVSGHLYHLYNPVVTEDMRRLLLEGYSAHDRPGLRPQVLTDGGGVWELAPR